MIYILLYYGQVGAGIFAFFQGVLIDIFSAGLMGLFTLIHLILFIIILIIFRFFDLHSIRSLTIFVTIGVFLKKILFFIIAGAFSFKITFSSFNFISFASSAIFSSLMAPIIFFILNNRFKAVNYQTRFFIIYKYYTKHQIDFPYLFISVSSVNTYTKYKMKRI